MVSRLSSFVNVVSLVASMVVAIVAVTILTTHARASADPGSQGVSIFYAVPSADGSSVTIAGLFQNDPNTSIPFFVIETDSCDDEGIELPNSDFTLTTNSSGYDYFTETLPTPSGEPAVLYLQGNDTPVSSNCYPVGADNTAWQNAATVPLSSGAGSTNGFLGTTGESRWYKFSAPADSTISITLSGLETDFSVAAYTNIAAADTGEAGGVSSLNTLSAESPSSAFSPSAFIPSAFIPSAFIPSAFIPSAFIPSAFIPSAFIPSAFIPSAFIPSDYSPSAFIPSAFIPSAFIPSAFSPSAYSPTATIPAAFSGTGVTPSAFQPQTYIEGVNSSLIAYSDEGATANKTITIHTWQSSGPFYIRVAGANGDYDANTPFQLSVSGGSGSCSASVLPVGSAPAAVAGSGANTVIVTDSSKLAGGSNAVADMMNQLHTLAARPEVHGVVVDLAGNSRVQALDSQAAANASCPYATNLAAGAIRDVINSYRANNPLKYVVIAGPDGAIPFFRHPDQTLIGNETGYNPPVADNTVSQASLRLGYTLSDNDYGAKTTLLSQSDSFPVPDLAVGRLVESASEISGMISAYLQNIGGVLPTPTSALVTGYDFLTLPANSVESDLTAGLGHSTDTLIAPRTQAPADSWTAADLKQKVLNSGRHDIVFLAGHFSGIRHAGRGLLHGHDHHRHGGILGRSEELARLLCRLSLRLQHRRR